MVTPLTAPNRAAIVPPAEVFSVPPTIVSPTSFTCAPLPEARIRAFGLELMTVSFVITTDALVPSAAMVPEFMRVR